ncbi:sulfotransferase [Thermodesulfobacteriota bacterium]
MRSEFRLLMISAMYENGGNTTHRFLDGHPQMFVYPFESQLGTHLVNDRMSSLFPLKYRWPVFGLDERPNQDFFRIIDEECKIRARTPHVSKFRHMAFDFSDDERCEIYQKYVSENGRSRPKNIEAFFRATFEAWKNYNFSGKEELYVGYSPIIVVDAEKILSELPHSHLLHVVRNPWSAYADTKKRPVPMALDDYMLGWTLNQFYALLIKKKYPDKIHIIRIEDVMADSSKTLGRLCETLGLEVTESLKAPSWNGEILEEVYPWGTICHATPEANFATAEELTPAEREKIRLHTWQYLTEFNYETFI